MIARSYHLRGPLGQRLGSAEGVTNHVWEVGEIVDLLGKGNSLRHPTDEVDFGPRATVMEAKDLREGCALLTQLDSESPIYEILRSGMIDEIVRAKGYSKERASQLVDETMAAIGDGEFPVSLPT